MGINSGFITGIVTRKHPLCIQPGLTPLNRGPGCVSQRVLLRLVAWGHPGPLAFVPLESTPRIRFARCLSVGSICSLLATAFYLPLIWAGNLPLSISI